MDECKNNTWRKICILLGMAFPYRYSYARTVMPKLFQYACQEIQSHTISDRSCFATTNIFLAILETHIGKIKIWQLWMKKRGEIAHTLLFLKIMIWKEDHTHNHYPRSAEETSFPLTCLLLGAPSLLLSIGVCSTRFPPQHSMPLRSEMPSPQDEPSRSLKDKRERHPHPHQSDMLFHLPHSTGSVHNMTNNDITK